MARFESQKPLNGTNELKTGGYGAKRPDFPNRREGCEENFWFLMTKNDLEARKMPSQKNTESLKMTSKKKRAVLGQPLLGFVRRAA